MLLAMVACGFVVGATDAASFQAARPVWLKGRETEINVFAGFRAIVDGSDKGHARLRLTASTVYRAWLNGTVVGYGPARAAHGYFRVDEWPLDLQPGRNVVAVEVAGYNTNSYYTIDQPSFLQAEVIAGGQVLAATGSPGDFEAKLLEERLQKVQRYSFQRPASEVYDLVPGYAQWRTDPDATFEKMALTQLMERELLPRRVPYPRFERRQPLRVQSVGRIETGVPVEKPWKDRGLRDIGPKLKGYPEHELARIPSLELQTFRYHPDPVEARTYAAGRPLSLSAGHYATFDFGTNLAGFPGARVVCTEPARVFMAFDETLTHEDVDWKRLGCVNILDFKIPEGGLDLEAFEPYTLRYLKVLVVEGACDIEGVYLREYVNPDTDMGRFASSDIRLNRIYEAGLETYRQNALDVFMDCPSRERAGWLCDSFFTARTAYDVSGDTAVEHNFIENYLLPSRFEHLPEGMLPMCYPADHPDGVYIPNWALWFVVQLEEYLARSGDRATVDALEPRVMALFDFFKRYRNSDGLLENLESWVFIEWSRANAFVQDVNYPSNMLYAAALAIAGRLYGRPELVADADAIREVIRKQSFDGRFFVDNAIRKEGKLEVTQNRSEVCQYFAFYFGVATPDSHPELWKTLREEFGPQRKEANTYEEVHMANAFVGNMLRMEILSRYGHSSQILDELSGYLLYMAERTGTLWENQEPSASLNHGFASHAVHTLYRDVLGVRRIDSVGKTVHVRFSPFKIEWCEGKLPTPDGTVAVRWRKDGNTLAYRIDVPAGYHVEVENPAEITLVEDF